MANKYIQAILSGPGPRNWREAFVLWLKGLCMGGADIIPGVSGGTMAFITGIYSDLITAITSVGGRFFSRLVRFDIAGALDAVHLRFLIPLFLGIATALVSMARLMHYLLEQYPVPVWSLFFGLIAASILVVGRQVKQRGASYWVMVALGAAAGFIVVGLIPVQTPNDLWFVFFCGALAICAMILPGISGAFILLLLGKYAYVTGALKNPFTPESMLIIIVFVAGAALGLGGFSRVLKWLFDRWHDPTIAVLTGFMIGAMRKIWPWKEVVETRVIQGKVYVIQEHNIWPPAYDQEFFLALAVMVAGFAAVVALEMISTRRGPDEAMTETQ